MVTGSRPEPPSPPPSPRRADEEAALPAPRHIYQIYVRASQVRVWQAITDPEFTRRYFFGTAFEAALEPGAAYRYVTPDGSDAASGIIEVVDPPHRLVMTWQALYDAAMAEEPPSRVEWRLAPGGAGVTRVTAIHGDLDRSPRTSESIAGGMPWLLGSMKSLLETGEALPPPTEEGAVPVDDVDGEAHRAQAIEANNAAWELLAMESLTDDEAEDLVRRAYAAAYHWARASRRGPENEARAEYMIAKAHWTIGQVEAARRHARRCLDVTAAAGLEDFDLAYAHEAMARAAALAGDATSAAEHWAIATAVPINDEEDRQIVEADFAHFHP